MNIAEPIIETCGRAGVKRIYGVVGEGSNLETAERPQSATRAPVGKDRA